MQPSHGQGGRGQRRNEENRDQRLQRANTDAQRQAGVPYLGQPGAAPANLYPIPAGFPQQGQPRPFGQVPQGAAGPDLPDVQFAASAFQRQPDNWAYPMASPGMALQIQPGAIRAPLPQPYAAFYPQFQPAYGYLAPGAPWRPVVAQQLAAGFPQQALQQQAFQAAYAYPPQARPPPPGRQPGRQGRGRGGRQYNPNRAQGTGQQDPRQFRNMWQQVTQVRHPNQGV